MSITFITSKLVYVLAWTTGDTSNLFYQSLYQVCSVYSSTSSGAVTVKVQQHSQMWYRSKGGRGAEASLEFWYHASAICSGQVCCLFHSYVYITELFWKPSGC